MGHIYQPTTTWSVLDNSAKIIPHALGKYYSSFFRLETLLKESVIVEALETAIQKTIIRYPLFQVCLRRGFFWYFLEHHKHDINLLPLKDYEPCFFSPLAHSTKNIPCWRVLVHGNRVALEVSHIITDGVGALEFLKTLLCVYYEIIYGTIQNWNNVKHPNEPIDDSELEYGYQKYFEKKKIPQSRTSQSFRYPDARTKIYRTSRLIVSLSQTKKIANDFQVSITALITSIHLSATQILYADALKKKNRVIRELLLINLRTIFSSNTLRNFYLFIKPEINFALGHYTLKELALNIHHQSQYLLDPRIIQQTFSNHLRAEKTLFNRLVPRPIKSTILKIVKQIEEKKIIGSISNLGQITLPQELHSLVSSVSLFPLPSQIAGRNIGIVGYQDNLTINVGKYINNYNLEKEMAKKFLSLGIDTTYFDW